MTAKEMLSPVLNIGIFWAGAEQGGLEQNAGLRE